MTRILPVMISALTISVSPPDGRYLMP